MSKSVMYGLEHAVFTQTYSMDMIMQHGHEHAAWTHAA
jgi:hypothetical protein